MMSFCTAGVVDPSPLLGVVGVFTFHDGIFSQHKLNSKPSVSYVNVKSINMVKSVSAVAAPKAAWELYT